MKWLALGAICLSLVSCSDEADEASISDDISNEDTFKLIQADRPEACATDEVRRAVIHSMYAGYEKYLEDGGPEISLEAITATNIETTVHEVNCSANVELDLLGYGDLAEEIQYTIRPDQGEHGSWVLSGQWPADLQISVRTIATRFYEKMKEEGVISKNYTSLEDRIRQWEEQRESESRSKVDNRPSHTNDMVSPTNDTVEQSDGPAEAQNLLSDDSSTE